MIIPYVNLKKQFSSEKKSLLNIIKKTLSTGVYISNNQVNKFEKNIKKFLKVNYVLALNSGTDALTFALFALGIKRGDEVITPPNSFIASTATIVHLGATPVFADVLPDQNIDPEKIISKITNKTKAIMVVHLTGRPCNMKEICKISNKYKIPIIEDAAQAIGSKYNKKFIGTFGDFGCFSAHPLKNLNAIGDSGYLIIKKKKYFNKIKLLRSHGFEGRDKVNKFGYVSRMDEIQASILNFRLKNLKRIIAIRRNNASYYISLLKNCKNIYIPKENKYQYSTYHTFVIQTSKRDSLKSYLLKKGVDTKIHYPIPIHLQPASKKFLYKKGSFPITESQSKKILTLPINQYIKRKEIKYICKQIINFYKIK
jgi:dTDP-4-amino-4,6-dideoxygalactose transaminase